MSENVILVSKGSDEFGPTKNVLVTEDDKILYSANVVWNPLAGSAGEWEKEQQAVLNIGDLTVTFGDTEALLADNYWKDIRRDYVLNNNVYIGKNTTHKAGTTAETWYIWKNTFTDGNLMRTEGPLVGAWDSRTGLAWG